LSPMHDLRFVTAGELDGLRRGGTVVVAFLATWNRRCQAYAPRYREFAARHGAKVAVVCVDVDEASAVAAAYDVCSVPTVILLEAGIEAYREVGLELAALEARLG